MRLESEREPPQVPLTSATDKQVCDYIAWMCSELVRLTNGRRLRTVNYLLSMAELESGNLAKKLPD